MLNVRIVCDSPILYPPESLSVDIRQRAEKPSFDFQARKQSATVLSNFYAIRMNPERFGFSLQDHK